jgi:hypothetical protein
MIKMWLWQVGDPSFAVTADSHDASQEAKGVVMEAIIVRYYCSLSTISDQALFRYLICTYFWCYLSWNLEEAVEHLTMAILVNPNSATMCYSCYAGCKSNSISGMALATTSPTPQVAGNSTGSICIMLWLVVSPI